MKYAKGHNALAICDRCGMRVRYDELVPDGQTPGLLVHPSCRDVKHPAEKLFRTDEGVILKKPRPDRDDDTTGDIEDITGTAQAGGANTITLASDASPHNGAYLNCTITLTGGAGNGQAKTIQGYNGSSKVATVLGDWTTEPDVTTTYSIDVPSTSERLFGSEPYFGEQS